MYKQLLKYNLQFFGAGDETSENMEEVAAPSATDNGIEENPAPTEDTTDESIIQESAEPDTFVQSDEENKRFAAARRKAEEDYNNKLNAINGEFQRMFGNMTNPVTGRPIATYKDFLETAEHQQKIAQEQELMSKGIDPAMLESMISNSPVIRQAQQVIDENRKTEAQRQLEIDIKVVSEIDPSVKSIEDLSKHQSFGEVLKYVNGGLSLPDAFKLANYDTLSTKRSEAVKQAAINQAKGKSHLEATKGVQTNGEELQDIPADEISVWKDAYPGLSESELKKKYNATL